MSNIEECAVMSAKEAACYLGISMATFYNYIKAGIIKKGIRYPKRRRVWRREDIEKLLDEYEEE